MQKTLFSWEKGKNVEKISKDRGIKARTVWQHLANLIEYNQLSVWKILSPCKVKYVLQNITSENDTLKSIKMKIKDGSASFDEINCVLSHVKSMNRSKNMAYHCNWYQKNHCLRTCYLNKKQRKECAEKFDRFVSKNPDLKMKRREFIDLFNNHINICILPEKEKRSHISGKRFNIIQSYFKKNR